MDPKVSMSWPPPRSASGPLRVCPSFSSGHLFREALPTDQAGTPWHPLTRPASPPRLLLVAVGPPGLERRPLASRWMARACHLAAGPGPAESPAPAPRLLQRRAFSRKAPSSPLLDRAAGLGNVQSTQSPYCFWVHRPGQAWNRDFWANSPFPKVGN